MDSNYIFKFKTNLNDLDIDLELNNPFGKEYSEVSKIACQEFQDYIEAESHLWDHDFTTDKGKMFGLLVIKLDDGTFAYLATVSGKLKGKTSSNRFVPSVFKDNTDDFFINKGMKELTLIGNQIKVTESKNEVSKLTELRKQKSIALQQKLFKNYTFLNIHGKSKNVLEIFEEAQHGNPPAAAGECAAPKLLQFAFDNSLKPIAIAEFWWGLSPKSEERQHKKNYPACKNKCRPIMEFMLDDRTLYNSK